MSGDRFLDDVPVPADGPARAREAGTKRLLRRRAVGALAGVVAAVAVVGGVAAVASREGPNDIETVGPAPAGTGTVRPVVVGPNVGPVITQPAAGFVMDAIVRGPLTYDDGIGCTYIGGRPVVWPFGTTWQPDPAAVLTGKGTVIPVGVEVEAGGGDVPIDRLRGYVDEAGAAALAPCLSGMASVLVLGSAGVGPAAPPNTGPIVTAPPMAPRTPRMAALIRGVLTYDEATGCAYVDGHLAVFVYGTRWDPAARRISSPDGTGRGISVGEGVDSGGGYISLSTVRDIIGDEGADALARCAAGSSGEDGVAFMG